ncbi:MAG: hypothetical protein WD602_02120 [Actinomycetota bacterium]
MASVFPEVTGGSPSAYSPSPAPDDVDLILAAARKVIEHTAAILDGLADTAVMVPRSEWSVGEHGAHIAFTNIGFGMFALGVDYPYGDGTAAGLAEANEVSLAGFPERDGTALAEQLRQGMETFAQVAGNAAVDQLCPSPLGTMPLGVLSSYFLTHNLMHACAISAGLNRDFPVHADHLPLVWPMAIHTLPNFVNATAMQGVSGCVRLSSAGGFEAIMEVQDGQLSILPAPTGEVDCYVEGDPVHLFLVLIKMLTADEAVDLGHLEVSGSQPELFARVMSALELP